MLAVGPSGPQYYKNFALTNKSHSLPGKPGHQVLVQRHGVHHCPKHLAVPDNKQLFSKLKNYPNILGGNGWRISIKIFNIFKFPIVTVPLTRGRRIGVGQEIPAVHV